jgi:catechol 2,3-dioxygenase
MGGRTLWWPPDRKITHRKAKNMLSKDTRLGQVHITVSDLDRSLDFYQGAIGLQLHRRGERKATLGAGNNDILVLNEEPGAIKVPQRSGLYHFAILVPSRLDLAYSLARLIEIEAPLSGGADHLVSEALYLNDPDGNGIEIYRDRPRSTWRKQNGQLVMATEPLDYQGILNELPDSDNSWKGMHSDTVLGHMHLHVAHLEEATEFYMNVVGLELMVALWGSASFLSVAGYHHHLGLNIWNGVGAPPPPKNSIGLRYFTIKLQDFELEELNQRLNEANTINEMHEEGLLVQDPSQNRILFSTI